MATLHTPVQRNRNVNGQCPLCIEEDEPLMVLCTTCKRKFHVTCIDLTTEQQKSLLFVCKECVEKAEQAGRTIVTRKFSKQVQEKLQAEGTKTQFNINAQVFTPQKQTAKSNKSYRSASSAAKKKMLELRLENLQKQEEVINELEKLSSHCSQDDDESEHDENLNDQNGDDENIVDQKVDIKVTNVQAMENTKQTPNIDRKPNDIIPPNTNEPNSSTNQPFYSLYVKIEDLHSFDGNPEDWPLFISHYRRSTERRHYSDDDNLSRLQKALKGKAKSLVASQLCMPSCVPNIIKTLERTFGRPEHILHAQIEKIRLEPPVRKDKFTSLINFSSLVSNLCATMEASKMSEYINSPLLLQELVQKLPTDMQLDWAGFKIRQATHNLITFQEWMNEMAEKVCTVMPHSVWKSEPGTSKPKEKHRVNVHVESQSKPVATVSQCPICKNYCDAIEKCPSFKKLNIKEKWDVVKKYKICRCCLKIHPMKFPYRCQEAKRCGVNNCDRMHHQLMHNDNPNNASDKPTQSFSQQPKINATLCSHIVSNSAFQFRYIPVVLSNEGQTVTAMAFLDEGSSGTYIEQSLAEKLLLKGPKVSLCLRWTKKQHRIEKNSMKVSMSISGTYNNAPTFNLTNAQTVESLDLPKQSLNYAQLTNVYPYLSHLPVKSYNNEAPQLLIGLNNWRYAVPLKVKEGNVEQPIATKCRLGWSILAAGRTESSGIQSCNFHDSEITDDRDMHLMMKKFFSIESMGVKTPAGDTASKEEQRALSIMEETTKFIGDRYETGLLWCSDEIKLPDNRQIAIQRLNYLEARLKHNPVLLENIRQQISQYIQKGYIRKIEEQELNQHHERVWYLPIFPTSNPNKPEKTRIVWDAASKTNNIALNSVLLKGPDQLSSLFGILIRFREKKIAITGDIAEMFHQVRIIPQDQHSQRFIWRDCDMSKDYDEYLMQVMTFGATCSPASAQFVKNYNAKKFCNIYPRAVKSIITNHYVDDMLDCTDDVQEALDLIDNVTEIHHAGGFHIRKWKSNSKEVMKKFGDAQQNSLDLNFGQHELEKVLGMFWDLEEDCFTFSLKFNKGNQEVLKGNKKPTKREILRILMSIYDPMGLISNFLSYLKVLLREIWNSKVDWDDEINNDHFKQWLRWVEHLPFVERTNTPRCYLSKINCSWQNACKQLHIFTDASQENCCAVAYLRLKDGKNIHCALVSSKTKVAPIKLTSIPRLELIAALLGARMAKTILESFSEKITDVTFWTDSQVVLKWINSDAKRIKGQFVAFRVAEIQDISEVKQWRHVPTNENVADEATKWKKFPTFEPNQRWFQGPAFLYEDEDTWPQQTKICPDETELVCVHQEIIPIISVERFSNWNAILKTAAFVYRFVNIIQSRAKHKQQPSGILTSSEYKSGENLLFRQTQFSAFSEEIESLKKSGMVPKSSWTYKLCPFLDENNVMCSKTRISHVKLIILPRHELTRLIVHEYHVRYLHQLHETVVNELKKKYYIPQIRRELNRVVKDCQECKNQRVIPLPPKMADLPECRLSSFQHAFSHTGVDYFGPINVKVGRNYVKRWGCLFVCMTTRAIHIEVAHELSTDAFILCYRNFLNRRGPAHHIYSDNGTNFVGAEKVLKTALNEINNEEIAATFMSTELQWHFNPPSSPHFGGAWERIVRTVKNAFYAVKPFHTMTDPLFNSYMIEIENMVNSRPLTYLPLDSDENEALTPNHFIRFAGSASPIGTIRDDAKFMKFNWQTSQLLAQRFWKRWVSEYLPTLTRRSKWCEPTEPLVEGDIVIVCDPNSTRNTWPKGRVVQVNYGNDGQTRSAVVQTISGLFLRPTVKLAKLDVVKPSTLGVENVKKVHQQ